MLVDTAQSPGMSVHSSTVSSTEASAIDGQRPRGEPTAAATYHVGRDPWPVSASVAAWLAGVSESEAEAWADASHSGNSRSSAPSTARQISPAPADSSAEALLAVGRDTLASSSKSEHDGDAADHAGSLRVAAIIAVSPGVHQAAAGSHGLKTPLSSDALSDAAASNALLPELRPGPWQVSVDAHPTEAACADLADTADTHSRANAVPGAALAAAAHCTAGAAGQDGMMAAALPAVQFLLEDSAQTAVQIAPHVAAELQAVEGIHLTAAPAAAAAEPTVRAVVFEDGRLPASDADSIAPAAHDSQPPAQKRATLALAASRTVALPPPVPVSKAPSVASTDSRRGSLRALKLRLAARTSTGPPRPQSAPTADRAPTLVQPRWSIARPASPSRDPNQACGIYRSCHLWSCSILSAASKFVDGW